MSQRQQLLSMQSMLEHVAREATTSGYGLIATLSAAAAEAARQELAARDHVDRHRTQPAHRKERIPVVA